MFRTALLKKIKLTNRKPLTVEIKQQFYRRYTISSNFDSDSDFGKWMGEDCNVVEALKNIYINQMKTPIENLDSLEDNNTKSLFCVEDSLLASDVKVSVDNVGPVSFPITEDVIKKLINISEKAQFGKGQNKVLDTSYRDTQMIPADKFKVDIDQKVLDNFLERIGQEFHIEEDGSKLKIHLYNMLIYGPRQFFKQHQDSLKIPNMIASLVMVLPSPHKGGDLIIEHQNSQHKFFGSQNSEIIKCVAFYSDCFHEVEKVEEGYRVALTYNVEIKPSRNIDVPTVDEKLKDAVKEYFDTSKSDKLVYLLEYQYTERNLRWNMLKGSDRIFCKALLAVGKQEGYPTWLALVNHHESFWEDFYDDMYTKLYFCVDEKNIGFHCKYTEISPKEICFISETSRRYSPRFLPYKTEAEGFLGNEPALVDHWYHRSAVVLWRNKCAISDMDM